MANDRLWLTCKVCEARVLLAKHMLYDWYAPATGGILDTSTMEFDASNEVSAGTRMELFIEEHGQLLHGYEEGKDDRQPFVIEYEAPDPSGISQPVDRRPSTS